MFCHSGNVSYIVETVGVAKVSSCERPAAPIHCCYLSLLQQQFSMGCFDHVQVPTSISEVPQSMLNPEAQWGDKQQFQSTLKHLAELYTANFNKYASGGGFVSKDLAERIVSAGPHLLQNGSK